MSELFGEVYDLGDNGIWVFVLITCILGGAGAYLSGQALAQTWRPYWQVPIYMLGITVAVRFMHYALFEGPFVSATSFAVDYIVTVVAASIGYRIVRASQMSVQYGWLFDRAGPLGWRRKA